MHMGYKVNNQTAPFWHNYSIDKFFSHFNSFSILPGYANGDDDEIASNDTFQLSSVMQQLEQICSKYQTEVHTVPIPDQSATTKSIYTSLLWQEMPVRRVDEYTPWNS